jgi:hypothetical protein
MQANKIKIPEKKPEKIGVIAGYGDLPNEVLENIKNNGDESYFVSLKSITNVKPTLATKHIEAKITAVGKILNYFEQNKIKKVIFVGGLKRPSFTALIPDLKGAKLLSRLRNLKKAGDNSIFDAIFQFLQEEGFETVGIKEIAPDLLTTKGILGKVEPNIEQLDDIEYGFNIAKKIGELDIGQSIVAHQKTTLAVEGIDGTDALIDRCKKLHFGGKGGILVKVKKNNQDDRIDLPTIGIKTIEKLKENNFSGIAIEAGESIIINKNQVIELANKYNIFIFGL